MPRRTLASLLLLLAACASQPAPAPSAAPAPAPMAAAAPAVAPATPPCNAGSAILNALLWMQSAAEYRAAATQTYNVARRMLDAALDDRSWSAEPSDPDHDPAQPPAIILDLDETAWSNAPFEARVARRGLTYDAGEWKQWLSEAAATPVPGAAEFLAYAKSRGVTPFYVTNRDTTEKPMSRANLEKLGYPLSASEDTILLRNDRPEWSSGDKTARRTFIASRYRVLLLLGDDLNDFTNAREKSGEERDRIIADTASRWGTQWLIVPNPIYGSWERPLNGGATDPCAQLQKKMESLQEKRR